MVSGAMKKILAAGVATSALIVAVQSAHAGAFAIREQSPQAQGEAFAGVAAGAGGLSSMFWNPATITKSPGWNSQWGFSGIIPSATITPVPPTPTLAFGGSGDIAQGAVLPSSATNYQWNEWLFLGLNTNTPFGLTTASGPNWAGQVYGQTSRVTTFEATPTVGIKINDWISVGAGVRVLYFRTRLTSALGTAPNFPSTELKGDAVNVGFSAGLTLTPFAGTELGFGYRSQVRENLKGTFTTPVPIPGLFGAPGAYSITSKVTLPDQVTVGLRQRVTNDFSVLAGFEWTHWGGFQRFPVCVAALGGACPAPLALAFRYKDGYYTSLGAEYRWNPALTLRAGVAYEKSPITDQVRGVRLPDTDRIWATIGAGYQITNKLSLDASYAHIFAKSSTITITSVANPAFNGLPFVATTKGRVDIVSASLSYRWDDPKVISTESPKGPIVRKY